MLWLILSSAILHCVLLTNADGLYSVVAPKTLRSKSAYNVVVAVQNAPRATNVSVSLTGPSFSLGKHVEVSAMSSKTVRFDIPKLTEGKYKLEVVGSGGIEFRNSTKLDFATDKNRIYIQTDKATYKPGDKIQFRVLFLDKHTRPAVIDKAIAIEIRDGDHNLIRQWKDIIPRSVYSGELQLSDRPVLGNWTLTVTAQDDGKETKTLVVDKYVVPKFEVFVITAKDVAASAGYIRATIRARYTFKKPVKGHVVASIEGSSAKKNLPIDGQVNVEFPIPATGKSLLKITATVAEELTNLKHNATAYVTVHQHRHKLEDLFWPTHYRPGVMYEFKTVVRNLDGSPVTDSSKNVNFNVKCCHASRNFPAFLQNSIATQHIMLPDTTCKSCLVTVTYDTAANLGRYLYKLDATLNIAVITKRPQLRKELKINIKSNNYLPYIIVTILARGNIFLSQYIKVEEREKSHEFKFVPTFEMVPQATIFVHYIVNGDFMSAKETVDIEKDFENTIEISTEKEARPGDKVSLRVKTNPHSFVGLLGVDQSVLLLRSGNDLNREQILNNLATDSTDLVTLTNANIFIPKSSGGCYTNDDQNNCTGAPISRTVFQKVESVRNSAPVPTVSSSKAQASLPPVRKLFPETWLFSNIRSVGASGETSINTTVPDTMTSWVITGFSLNYQTGLAVTRNPHRIRVFQPFFVTTNLPYSVKHGEVIAIPVVVFNYLGMDVEARVSMDNSEGEYEFIETTSANVSQKKKRVEREKKLWIPASTGRSISFMIRPRKVGLTTLKISAISPNAGDRLHQILKVEAEGVPKYVNKAVLITVQRRKRRSLAPPEKTLVIEEIHDAVEGSVCREIQVSGSSQAPQLEHLDGLVRKPYGCGEQNMFNFVPSILALSYLEASNRSDKKIEHIARVYVETGYQNELSYKRSDGSFSAWGKYDPAGSTWLTAYVIRSFHQAAKYIDIDDSVLAAGLDFIASRQSANGIFKELGRLIQNSHGSPLALTSFVLLTFFENEKYKNKYQKVIARAVNWVAEEVTRSNNAYDLAIAALALSLAKHRSAQSTLTKLESLAKRRGDHKWWTGADNSKSSDVETTSYVLLALLEQNGLDSAKPIVDWLISKRNSNGGFVSSQDTVVGIMALTKYELASQMTTEGIDVQLSYLDKHRKHLRVGKDNKFKVQTHRLPENATEVKCTATGQGRALVQLSYRYNVATAVKSPSFKLRTKVMQSDKYRLILNICGEYTPIANSERSKPTNMALMQVQLPSGYVCDTDSFALIAAIPDVKRVESKRGDTEVHIYFEKLHPNAPKCLNLKAIYTHAVAEQKPSWVQLYDYYATERKATEFYHVDSPRIL
ncbi:CD109 antigen [Drosophila erecta]|uniref:TEP1-F n=1 Tax=Drosophila erecta TaxID=7220 RepID=B3N624_DROER|nr:CD109 antigen [Drosophila erecta]EDV58062.1 Thioester-containing protein 1 [Drosophila erecta]